jgi:hypothetical protein
MKRLPETPVIPDEFLHQAWEQDELLQEAHAKLAALSLENFWTSMPGVTGPADRSRSAVVDLLPAETADPTTAIAIDFKWENGWRPGTAYGPALLQNSLEVPTRVLVFPHGRGAYTLAREELEDVRSGNFDPIAIRRLRTAEDLGVERIRFISTSEGATVGAAALKLLAVNGSMEADFAALIEPANTFGCTPDEKEKAVKAGGLRNLNRARNDSAIPALTEVEHSRGGVDTIRQLISFAPMLFPSRAGKAAHHGFTYPNFQRDLGMALDRNEGLHALVVGAADSRIYPPDARKAVRQHLSEYDNAAFYEVEGYGHKLTDNVIVHALLGKMALNPATYA